MAPVDERPRRARASAGLHVGLVAMLSLSALACSDEAARGPGLLPVAPFDASPDSEARDAPDVDAPDAPDAPDAAGNADAAEAAATPKKAVGEPCVNDDECATAACFQGNARAYCTKRCDPAKAGADCPAPPYTGVCNMHGFCKL